MCVCVCLTAEYGEGEGPLPEGGVDTATWERSEGMGLLADCLAFLKHGKSEFHKVRHSGTTYSFVATSAMLSSQKYTNVATSAMLLPQPYTCVFVACKH